MRIVDIEGVLKKLNEYGRPWEKNDLMWEIAHAPFVDAQPVVRCQNCKHCITETVFDYRCEVLQRKVYLSEYCCWGERRTDNEP